MPGKKKKKEKKKGERRKEENELTFPWLARPRVRSTPCLWRTWRCIFKTRWSSDDDLTVHTSPLSFTYCKLPSSLFHFGLSILSLSMFDGGHTASKVVVSTHGRHPLAGAFPIRVTTGGGEERCLTHGRRHSLFCILFDFFFCTPLSSAHTR